MIKTKQDLEEYIRSDNSWYPLFDLDSLKTKIIVKLKSDPQNDFKMFLYYLRKQEYHLNNSENSRWHKLLSWYYEGKKNRLGRIIGMEFPPNVCEKGIGLWHAGVLINPSCKIGENCVFHGNNCIGNKHDSDDEVPHLGKNVDIGYGALIIGKVTIADGTVIGANSLVIHDVLTPGTIVAGVPAKVIRSSASADPT